MPSWRRILVKCRKLIEPAWQKFQSENAYVSQSDSTALHTCLFGLLNAVSATEELADAAQEMTEQINLLRSHFEEIRFPSSTTLLARAKKEIQNLEQELATTIDFDWLKQEVTALQSESSSPGVSSEARRAGCTRIMLQKRFVKRVSYTKRYSTRSTVRLNSSSPCGY